MENEVEELRDKHVQNVTQKEKKSKKRRHRIKDNKVEFPCNEMEVIQHFLSKWYKEEKILKIILRFTLEKCII